MKKINIFVLILVLIFLASSVSVYSARSCSSIEARYQGVCYTIQETYLHDKGYMVYKIQHPDNDNQYLYLKAGEGASSVQARATRTTDAGIACTSSYSCDRVTSTGIKDSTEPSTNEIDAFRKKHPASSFTSAATGSGATSAPGSTGTGGTGSTPRTTSEKPKDDFKANSFEGTLMYDKQGKPNEYRKKDKTIRCYTAAEAKGYGYSGAVCFQRTGTNQFTQVTIDKKGKVTKGMSEKIVGEANNRQYCTLTAAGTYQSCVPLTCKSPPYEGCSKGGSSTSTDLSYLNVNEPPKVDADGSIEVTTTNEFCQSGYWTCFPEEHTLKSEKGKSSWTLRNGATVTKNEIGALEVVYPDGTCTMNMGGSEQFRGTCSKNPDGTTSMKTPAGDPVICTKDKKTCEWGEDNGETLYQMDKSKDPPVVRERNDDYTAIYNANGQMIGMKAGGATFSIRDSSGKTCPPAVGPDCAMRGEQNGVWAPVENYDCSKASDKDKCKVGIRDAARGSKMSWLSALNAIGSGVATASSLCGLAKNSAFCADQGISALNDWFEGDPIGQFVSGNWEDMICMNWKDIQGGDSGALIDPRTGTVSAWIAGDCMGYNANGTSNPDDKYNEYVCKTTMEINPSGVCDLPNIPEDPHTQPSDVGVKFEDEFIKFELVFRGPGEEVIDITQDPKDDYYKLPCNMSVFRLSGADMIIRRVPQPYEKVCMRFLEVEEQGTAENSRNLRSAFMNSLNRYGQGGSWELCNKIGNTKFLLSSGQTAGGIGSSSGGAYIPTPVND